jgi:protein TonB
VSRVAPAYPPLAIQARISGVVKFRTTVGADGSVRHITVISGHPLLVPNAIGALKEWKFPPQAAESDYQVEIVFSIADVSPGDVAAANALRTQPAQGKKAGPPGAIMIGPMVQAAKLINRVEPIYPDAARAAGIEGDITVQVTIGEDGSVDDAKVVDGNPVLAAAAIKAVWQWKYQPTLLNGQPVKVYTTVTVSFH